MKVLTVVDKGYPISGGAQLNHVAFLKRLSRDFGHDCNYADVSTRAGPPRLGDISFFSFRDFEELRTIIGRLRPDVIIAALNIIHCCARITRAHMIPLVAYLDSYEYTPYSTKEKELWKITFGKELPTAEERAFALREADTILTNSFYLKQRLWKTEGARSRVLYPEFDPNDFMIDASSICKREFITGICGYPHKGADIFYELAKIFPDEKFLVPGSVHVPYWKRFVSQRNITMIPYAAAGRFLSMSKIVLVPSQWPEPFGRIAVEAMANGIPTLASFTGGLKEIVRDSSLGVRNFRSVSSWQKALGKLLTSREAYERNGRQGRSLSAKFLKGGSTEELDRILKGLIKRKKPVFDRKKRIAICGSIDRRTAVSVINANWIKVLKNGRDIALEVITSPKDFSPEPIDYFIHHDYSRDFKDIAMPGEGKFIAVRTWDFGRFPRSWVEKINNECDALWVHSNWVKNQAISSKIEPRKVKVIPHGVDKTFSPEGKLYKISTKKRFKFIFVGATVPRKGIDILLKAYIEAFTSKDDVCLVIKDDTRDVLYSGIHFTDKIMALARKKGCPEIVYIDKYLSDEALASLYRSCDAGVFPYRAEGFAMPILEAMACGTPSIVPDFGSCRDFCSKGTSFLMPVKRINLPAGKSFMVNTLGCKENVDEVDFCETDVKTLVYYLRKVYNTSDAELKKKSQQGVNKARRDFTWRRSGIKIKKELGGLEKIKVPLRLRNARFIKKRKIKLFNAAKEMFLAAVQK